MEANYYLKVDKAKKKYSIRLHCSFDGEVLRYPAGKSVNPDQWSKDKQKLYSGVKDSETINQYLKDLRQSAIDEYYQYKKLHKRPFSPEYLKKFLDENYKSDISKPEFIEDYFIKYIEDQFNRVGEK